MESTLINSTFDHDSIPIKSQAHGFHLSNGIHHQIADIEMVSLQPPTYISLRDILPACPPYDRKESWREIPIKDPLVQHAAWAYLQPMAASPRQADGRSFLAKLRDGCCGLVGLLFTEKEDVDAK